MTKVTFETATLADVVKRAAAVAPTRGEAFDKVAGVIFKIEDGSVTVMATDTTVFYMEAISATSVDGGNATWRIPSIILSSIVAKLPMGSGNTVSLDDSLKPPKVVLKCNKTVAEFNQLGMKYYPIWSAVSSEEMSTVMNFGAAVKQVLWATSNSEPLLTGVALFPDGICATDRYRMARIEMDTTMTDVVTVPGKILSRVIPDNGEVQIGVVGNNFMICPNAYTQIRTVVMADKYPPVGRVIDQGWEYSSSFSRTEFQNMLTRALDFASGDRQASMTLFIGKSEVALFMDNQEVGLFGDITDASGSAESHGRHKINFNPNNLRDAIATFPGEVVTMKYNIDPNKKSAVGFTNEANYKSVVQPLRPPTEES